MTNERTTPTTTMPRSHALRLLQAELGPARHRGVDVLLLRPDLGREARAAKLGIGVVVEVHGGVDQHAIPLAGAEQCGIAVALARRGIEPRAERVRHDDDVVLAGIDAM